MALPFIPKITYGSGPTVLTLTRPQKLWTPGAKSIGGKNVSESGIPEAFVIRRDQLVKTTIRFDESEWIAIDTWLAFAQTAQAFTYQFDKDVIGTAYTVYLEEPSAGDGDVTPDRDVYPKVMTLQITLRSTTSTRFDVRARP
jgi:hypothetical protein